MTMDKNTDTSMSDTYAAIWAIKNNRIYILIIMMISHSEACHLRVECVTQIVFIPNSHAMIYELDQHGTNRIKIWTDNSRILVI